jgi:cytochrome c oxidase cbb3-type subunit 3
VRSPQCGGFERWGGIAGGIVPKKLAFAFASFFALVISAWAQYPVYPKKPTPEQLASQQRGETLYKQNCAVCHAENLTGGRGPDLIRSALVRRDKDADLIGPVVSQGRVDKGMPPFPFSQSQIADLVAYINSVITVFDLHTRIPGGYPNDIPASQLATGSAAAGKEFFYGAGGCSKCHSPTGDLAGIAKKYDAPTLEQLFINPAGALVFQSAYNPGTTITADVTLKSGQHFAGRLEQNGEFYVSILGTDGWTHTWPRKDIKTLVIHNPMDAHIALLPKWNNKEMHDMFTYLETLQ